MARKRKVFSSLYKNFLFFNTSSLIFVYNVDVVWAERAQLTLINILCKYKLNKRVETFKMKILCDERWKKTVTLNDEFI